MSELIWVGNTLYPRWFVFSVPLAVLLSVALLAVFLLRKRISPRPAPTPLVWHDGVPPKPWASEWFIARTKHNDRVVLTALPEEYTYDFKTADDTYIKADQIKQWMQFPDSQFIAPDALKRK